MPHRAVGRTKEKGIGRKRRKAPKILLHPMFRWIRGKMGKIVYRTTAKSRPTPPPTHLHWHAGASVTGVVWSPAQKAQRQKMARATAHGKLAIRDPEIRRLYVALAKQRKKNLRRPFDMAVSDYCQGNDLLWKKLMGDPEKPEDWCWDPMQLPPVAGT